MLNLESLQERVGVWGLETFPQSTLETIAAHLCEEAAELRARASEHVKDAGNGLDVLASYERDKMAEEAADVLLLLLHLCHRAEIDLLDAAAVKFALCKGRKWEYDPEKGYSRHVSD